MIKLDKVSKTFATGTKGLSDINLIIEKGEFVFLIGHTGSGKTTLLRILIGETTPTEGDVFVGDVHLNKLSSKKIPQYRKKLGIIFQDLKLLMDRTILENILLPLDIGGAKMKDAVARAEELLQDVGILQHKDKFPIQLSGGELQRVAIARALSLSPDVLLADEPTGNLDSKTAFEIVDLLHRINEKGTTIIMATHNLDILKKYPKNRVIGLDNGKVIQDKKTDKNPFSSSVKIEITTIPPVDQNEEKKTKDIDVNHENKNKDTKHIDKKEEHTKEIGTEAKKEKK